LLDEPFSNLDPIHTDILKSVIRDIGEKLTITCMLVSHDPQDTLPWADEILVLEDGQLRQKGSPEQIYRQPVNEYVAGLFGRYNVIGPAEAAFLSTMPGIAVAPGIVRPEYFIIAKEDNGGVKGEVSRVSFVGGFYEVEVLLPGFGITVSTSSGHYVKGDGVYLRLMS